MLVGWLGGDRVVVNLPLEQGGVELETGQFMTVGNWNYLIGTGLAV